MPPFRLTPRAHVSYVQLQVSDLAQSVDFYERVLGFHVRPISDERVELHAAPGSPALVILSGRPGAIPKPPRTTGLFHIAIRYPTRRALGLALIQLIQSGWPVQGMSDHKVSEAIYLADPDGLGLELYADKPRDVWPQKNGMIAMVTDPLDLESLLRAAGEAPAAGARIDPVADIGHVHLQVADLDRAQGFYEGALGLDVMQADYPGALFLAVGGYHHYIGLNAWAGPNAVVPPTEAVGLTSYALALPDPAAAAELHDHLAGLTVEIEAMPDGGYAILDPDEVRLELVVG